MQRMLAVLVLSALAMVAWMSLRTIDEASFADTVWAVSILRVATPVLLLFVGDAVVQSAKRRTAVLVRVG